MDAACSHLLEAWRAALAVAQDWSLYLWCVSVSGVCEFVGGAASERGQRNVLRGRGQ
jgi:hypothetical protein